MNPLTAKAAPKWFEAGWCNRKSNATPCGHSRSIHTPSCQGILSGASYVGLSERRCSCPEFVEDDDSASEGMP